jgi:Tfp pilus assembly protein PilV
MRMPSNEGGFLLVEVAIVCLILSLALLTLVPLYSACLRANNHTLHTKVAAQLSQELSEEIRLRKWDQKTPTPAIAISSGSVMGLDPGESAADKRTFNDIDDFDGWTENGAVDPMMGPLSDFTGYLRQVSVDYVNSSLVQVAGPTDFKHVHVCTNFQRMNPVCVDTVYTNR